MIIDRRSFSIAFKHETACLVLDQGYSVQEACDALTLGAATGAHGVVYGDAQCHSVQPRNKSVLSKTRRSGEAQESRANRLYTKNDDYIECHGAG